MLEVLATAISSGAISAVVVVFLGRAWVEARIKGSIEHEYQKQLVLFQQELDRKTKVALIVSGNSLVAARASD